MDERVAHAYLTKIAGQARQFLSINHEANQHTVREWITRSSTAVYERVPCYIRKGYVEETVAVQMSDGYVPAVGSGATSPFLAHNFRSLSLNVIVRSGAPLESRTRISPHRMANPLCAFQEWLRVLKKRGIIFLVLPDKDGTFDHRRPVTAFRHLVRDLKCKRRKMT